MIIVMGALILLSTVCVFCALVISGKTDRRIRHYIRGQYHPIIVVRFPDDIFQTRASTEQRRLKASRSLK